MQRPFAHVPNPKVQFRAARGVLTAVTFKIHSEQNVMYTSDGCDSAISTVTAFAPHQKARVREEKVLQKYNDVQKRCS